MENLDLTTTFFEALNYPQYARPNFYLNKQKDSGWNKGVYLITLQEIYHESVMRLELKLGGKKSSPPYPDIELESVSVPLKEFTQQESTLKINKETLEELFLAILAARDYDKKEKEFTNFEILGLVEYALAFMLKEFKVQAKDGEYPSPRPRTDSYFTYFIFQGGPFFDFPRFKACIRELKLNSQHPENLIQILSKYHKAASEIVDLWNTKIYALNNIVNENGESPNSEIVRVEFNAEELKYSWWNDVKQFEIKPYKIFLNQDFAYYAANIANLIANEVLENKEKEVTVFKKDFVSDFIRGIKKLQELDTGAECVKFIKNDEKKEAPFRDWFSGFFDMAGYHTDRESLKGNGHIDLKVGDDLIGKKIIEFKGWWNYEDKKRIIEQLCKYLTEFEGDGYIFMINNLKENIVEKYKAIVTTPQSGYIDGTWDPIPHEEGSFFYFRSFHRLGSQVKHIFHFIYSVY